MLLTAKTDLETMFKASEHLRAVMTICDDFFDKRFGET
jgi:hypothetical protein